MSNTFTLGYIDFTLNQTLVGFCTEFYYIVLLSCQIEKVSSEKRNIHEKLYLNLHLVGKKKVFQITASSETKSINQPRKGHFDSVQLKYSSRSAQIHVKINLVTDHYPIRWITSHILSTNSTQKKRLKIKILLESFPF